MDYALCRRRDEGQCATWLVAQRRQPRAVHSWVVPQKGAAYVVATEIVESGLREFGIAWEVALHTDNEEATNALRHSVQALRACVALEQTPAAYAHEPARRH